MRRLAATALVLMLLACTALAQDAAVSETLDRAAALATSEPARSVELLLGVADDEAATEDERVRGIRIALAELPRAEGNRAAAALVLAVLRRNRSQPDAWQLAFRVRNRVIDTLDLATGEPFLRARIDLYPDQLRFRHDLVRLYRGAGRPELADEQCEEILRQAPNDTFSRRIRGQRRELEGRYDEALELYREIYEIDGDLQPLVWCAQILIESVRDYDAAGRVLAEASAALERAPPGRSRNAVRASLEYQESRLLEERQRRADLLALADRQDRILATILGVWTVALGGGLLVLRRRGLV